MIETLKCTLFKIIYFLFNVDGYESFTLFSPEICFMKH